MSLEVCTEFKVSLTPERTASGSSHAPPSAAGSAPAPSSSPPPSSSGARSPPSSAPAGNKGSTSNLLVFMFKFRLNRFEQSEEKS